MNQYPTSPGQIGTRVDVKPATALSTAFLSQAFFWMFVALLITTATGVLVSNLPGVDPQQPAQRLAVHHHRPARDRLRARLAIQKLSSTVALLLFFVYAASMGITLGVILISYDVTAIGAAGLSAASIFAAAAVYGAVTKRDLTSLGGILFIGLVGIIVASVVNLFVGWNALNFAISIIGVVIFTGLTAFDVQRIKNGQLAAFTNSMEKGAVLGAFALYLDFVNLFFLLLRLFGGRR